MGVVGDSDTEDLEGGTTRWARARRAEAASREASSGPRPGSSEPTHFSPRGSGRVGGLGARRRLRRPLLAAALVVSACSTEAPGTSSAGPTARERAAAWLAPSATLPARAEIVALADALAIESSKQGTTPEGAALARLAADLRVRAWRIDQAAADGREALELYAAAAGAGSGTEEGCEADARRALLAGEMARDARAAYREIYLASRRQAAVAPRAVAGRGAGCVTGLDLALAQAVAYRPTGDAMRALEREGNIAAEGARRGVVPVVAPPLVIADAAPPPASAAPVASASGDVVVSPKEDAVGTGPVKVTGIERYGSDKSARVVVQLSAPATFNVGTLPADDSAGKDARIYLDIARATARGIPREVIVGGAVRRVRVGAQASGTRVVLDLAAALHRRVFYLPEPFRIVVDVSTRPPVRADATTPSGAREVRRVAIDAGHGGVDDGAVGPTGLREKDVALDIAHRVAPLLSHELKIETLLTRDNDTLVPLEARTARANAFHADLFVSIHCNASESGVARGVQTFVLDDRASEGFASLAARENSPRGRSPLDPKALDAQMAAIFSNFNAGEMAVRSRHVADLLQRATLASLAQRYPDTKDQGVKTAGFYVLAGADMPAVLFETSFISNPDDESRLATADYRQKMADAIANAIKAYREGK